MLLFGLHGRDFLIQKCGSFTQSGQQWISYAESNLQGQNYFEAIAVVQISVSSIS
jgi:hypothetical protein